MRFRSERERQLAAEVVKQMITLVESLQQRMALVQVEADLQDTETGRLLLDAVCMHYLALGEAVKQVATAPQLQARLCAEPQPERHATMRASAPDDA